MNDARADRPARRGSPRRCCARSACGSSSSSRSGLSYLDLARAAGVALRRRGAAHPAGDPDRLGPHRRALRARRALASACTSATTAGSIDTLVKLKNLGNTLIVVEHDEDTIRTADWIVDIGPGAGVNGGGVVHSGSYEELAREHRRRITGDYLAGRRSIETPDEAPADRQEAA